MNGQLLVLAKHPVAGRVKTRLCPPCTPQQAAAVAAAALADTLRAVCATPAVRRVVALDVAARSPVDSYEVIAQRGAGLGERIACAFADTARTHGTPILQIGMDTPQVSPGLLGAGLTLLQEADAVLGVAEDGGWWALGLRDAQRATALRDVPMSTPDTGRLTAAALRRTGARVAYLPTLRDVDTMRDAAIVADQLPGSSFSSAVTKILSRKGRLCAAR